MKEIIHVLLFYMYQCSLLALVVPKKDKKSFSPLGLDSQHVVSGHVTARNQAQVLHENSEYSQPLNQM